MGDKTKLKNYVSESGEYLIPVSWSVYSTVKVKADNLLDAIERFNKLIDTVPLCSNTVYVDGSYRVDAENAEDYIMTQNWQTIGDVSIEENGNITLTRD